MSRLPVFTALTLLSLTACVPKAQFDTLVEERDAYRRQVVEQDSLAGVRSQVDRDSLAQLVRGRRQAVQQSESLTAANQSLTAQLTDVRARYEALLEQRSNLLEGGSSSTAEQQQDLLDRTAELNQREMRLQQRERSLEAREQSLSSIDEMRSQQPGAVRGTSPVDPHANAVLTADQVLEEVRQLMLASTDTGYVLERAGPATINLTLAGDLLFEGEGSRTVSVVGQRVLRRLGGTLRNYPQAEYTIVGHAESLEGDALLAYESSTDRAIRVAVQLAQFGVDSGRIVAGGKGFYGADAPPRLPGRAGERRTEVRITIPE
ncbi:hypothetical protein [Lewinella sp. IMCC34183]|uniref:hypothetical protein n=1 Tax=Lewinella sp. IMCC34183 TaxID=2248762 RepID=UPI000E262D41|nr:hypothetical protein [Lewinella sp. IMCC34183]